MLVAAAQFYNNAYHLIPSVCWCIGSNFAVGNAFGPFVFRSQHPVFCSIRGYIFFAMTVSCFGTSTEPPGESDCFHSTLVGGAAFPALIPVNCLMQNKGKGAALSFESVISFLNCHG